MHPLIVKSLSIAGPLTFLALQVSTFGTGIKIWTDKSVGTLSVVPFFALFVNCIVWTLYGLMIGAPPVYIPNTTGAFVGLFCTSVYHIHSPSSNKTLYACGTMVLSCVVLAALFGYPSIVGGIGSCLSLLLMASPLAVLRTVVRDKCTAAMPFTTSLSMLLASVSWSLYGLLVIDDYLVYIPNLIGLALSLIQMSLFLIYGFPQRKVLP